MVSEENRNEVPDEITFSTCVPDDISDEDLHRLVGEFTEAHFEGQNFIDSTRMHVKTCLQNLGLVSDTLGKKIYPDATPSEYLQHNKRFIMEALQKKQVITAKENGKTVGMILYREYPKKELNGRPFWFIGKACVLKEYQGRGVYKNLAQRAFEAIQSQDPQAPICRYSKSPKVKEHLRKLPGWHEVNLDTDTTPIADIFREGRDPKEIKRTAKKGDRLFYFDPLEGQ